MSYVHGYSERESNRLADQANALEELLLRDTAYPPGSTVLEAGCGVGAQTLPLTRRSPGAAITAIDLSAASLDLARLRLGAAGLSGVTFLQADVRRLTFADSSFDHVFVCFLLEHLRDPADALQELRRVLKPGGTITVIEGDHGTFVFHPPTPASLEVWSCLVQAQAAAGGDSLIGRRLYSLLRDAGFAVSAVEPRALYADGRTPGRVDVFARKIIAGMAEGIRDPALDARLVDTTRFDEGLADLRGLAGSPQATVCYTFFKALASR
jgi:SAM-dependent methyltransferase